VPRSPCSSLCVAVLQFCIKFSTDLPSSAISAPFVHSYCLKRDRDPVQVQVGILDDSNYLCPSIGAVGKQPLCHWS